MGGGEDEIAMETMIEVEEAAYPRNYWYRQRKMMKKMKMKKMKMKMKKRKMKRRKLVSKEQAHYPECLYENQMQLPAVGVAVVHSAVPV